jgi:hypothetical protein
MTVKNLFSGARFIGQAEGERRTYYVFQGESGYLVATPRSPRNYSVTLVQNEVPDVISRKFKGKQVTVSMLKSKGTRAGLFRDYFDRLNALYVMGRVRTSEKTQEKVGQGHAVQSEVEMPVSISNRCDRLMTVLVVPWVGNDFPLGRT